MFASYRKTSPLSKRIHDRPCDRTFVDCLFEKVLTVVKKCTNTLLLGCKQEIIRSDKDWRGGGGGVRSNKEERSRVQLHLVTYICLIIVSRLWLIWSIPLNSFFSRKEKIEILWRHFTFVFCPLWNVVLLQTKRN